jgi:2-C-methyl-D-erythritol 4-phosphate cytidylyltransferase
LEEYALIVAGGKGTRFGGPTPKQFLSLKGKPVLLHTVDAFYRYSPSIRIIIVLPEEEIPTWKSLAEKHDAVPPHKVIAGGETRFHSVKNGLSIIPDNGLVAIHDGVRPLVKREVIAESFKLASVHGTAVASVPLKESLRLVNDAGSRTVDRSAYRLIQTPQTFRTDVIKRAYAVATDSSFTDDASVAEHAGHRIQLFAGSFDNLKITTPEDLIIAEALLAAAP